MSGARLSPCGTERDTPPRLEAVRLVVTHAWPLLPPGRKGRMSSVVSQVVSHVRTRAGWEAWVQARASKGAGGARAGVPIETRPACVPY